MAPHQRSCSAKRPATGRSSVLRSVKRLQADLSGSTMEHKTDVEGHQYLQTFPAVNLFGPGCLAQLPDEMQKLSLTKALLIGSGTARGLKTLEMVAGILGEIHARTWGGCTAVVLPGERAMHLGRSLILHTYTETALSAEVVLAEKLEEAVAVARECGADCVVTLGGGGAVGMGKMVALNLGFPLICIATTYSGSELTCYQSMVENGAKKMHRTAHACMRVYDAHLAKSLPVSLSIQSGVNACAHPICVLFSSKSTRIQNAFAPSGISGMLAALQRIHDSKVNPISDDAMLELRDEAFHAAFMCQSSSAGPYGLGHRVAHVLVGTFGLAHASCHSTVLSRVIALNSVADPQAAAILAGILQCSSEDVAATFYGLQQKLGAATSLEELGLKLEDIGSVVEHIMKEVANPLYSADPRPWDEQVITQMLTDMWHDRPPSAYE